MTIEVPSYLLKFSRADEHLIELKHAISEYSASYPYELRPEHEGSLSWRLHFTGRLDRHA